MPEEPVTIFISRRFKPGTDAAVEQWTREVRQTCATFHGFLGRVTLQPHAGKDETCHFVFRFASFADLRRWEESAQRAAIYQRLQPLMEEHVSRLHGYEPWFPVLGLNQRTSPSK